MRILLSLLLLAVGCAPRRAAPRVGATRAKPAFYYVDASKLAFVADFPPPPGPGSEAERSDAGAVQRLQDGRTEAQCAKARLEEVPRFEAMFGGLSPLGKPLPADAAAFFERVSDDSYAAAKIIKNRYRRPRPPLSDPTLKPCVSLPKGFSYPSFHATAARLYAFILTELVPARSAEFMARAEEAALARNLGGVHYPSDSEAGKKIADAFYAELRRSPAFNSDLERLRSRIER
ncbi:MAG: phosphatase PAP2 family protein [Elusimicrobia bacterium]|nr:phosphatase PAP2 family protein [Elusimicrobiota bacterium]